MVKCELLVGRRFLQVATCRRCPKSEDFPSLFLPPRFQTFVMRYKGASEHWVGLSRDDEERPWEWVNRSRFSHL